MGYQPTSRVLILTICSLNKLHGGTPEYDSADSIVSHLPDNAAEALLSNRERVRRLVRQAKDLDWQGVPLSELEFNDGLVDGPDFGGREAHARYYPALRRYEGRFFQTLGVDGKRQLFQSAHHVLFLSGLYGLLLPMELIQLYSCPVKPQVADLWSREDALTNVFAAYVRQHGIRRIFDLTAVAAYRDLIDWTKITRETGADALHCFDIMAAGDYALIPFAKLMKDFLLGATEQVLLDIEPEWERDSIVFRSIQTTSPGLPVEILAIQSAEREIPLLQAHSVEYLNEVVRGGNPIGARDLPSSSPWLFAITSEFRKDISKLDKTLQGRVMAAIVELCHDPMSRHGDTIRQLSGHLAGKWRWRLGDYRLIYLPDEARRAVFLLKIASRGDPELYD